MMNSPCGSHTTSGQSAQSRNTVPKRGCASTPVLLLPRPPLAAANLAAAFRAAALPRCRFSRGRPRRCLLSRCRLSRCRFPRCRFPRRRFSRCRVPRCRFSRCRLPRCRFSRQPPLSPPLPSLRPLFLLRSSPLSPSLLPLELPPLWLLRLFVPLPSSPRLWLLHLPAAPVPSRVVSRLHFLPPVRVLLPSPACAVPLLPAGVRALARHPAVVAFSSWARGFRRFRHFGRVNHRLRLGERSFQADRQTKHGREHDAANSRTPGPASSPISPVRHFHIPVQSRQVRAIRSPNDWT